MPGGDRTGPRGMGPRTGHAAGFCAGFQQPGYMNPVPGRGAGRGGGCFGGGGRGRRNWFYATGLPGWARSPGGYDTPAIPGVPSESQALKGQAELLQSQLDLVNQRINELEAKTNK